MQTRTFRPQEWTRPLSGYRLAGWIEGFGLLAGIGAIPLLVQLSWLKNWFWVVSLASGLLVVGAGLFYLARSRRITRAQARRADPNQVLVDKQLSGHSIKVTARSKSQAAGGAEAASPKDAAPPAGADPQDDLRQASILIILGTFILLPAVSVPLLYLAKVEAAHRAAAFLGGPALMLWVAFEGLAFYAHGQQPSTGRISILGMIRCGAQILAALLAWIFLGLADSLAWLSWLFWTAGGLVLLSALAGTFMPLVGRQPATPTAASLRSGTDVAEPGPTVTHTEPLLQPEAASKQQVLSATTPALFQIFQGTDEQLYFRLCAANGETILSSKGYRSKSGCLNGIKSVRQNALIEERFERRETPDGLVNFILKAANHQVIGTSESYKSIADCEAGIKAVMRVVPQAGAEEVI